MTATIANRGLREIAAQAWERQQAEVAERKRQEQEHARRRLISEVHRALRGFTHTYDPFSPLTEADVEAADIHLVETADGTPFEADVLFAGERFRYSITGHGHALYHVWACPICGDRQESTTGVSSPADLGYWLGEAPKRCYHGGDL